MRYTLTHRISRAAAISVIVSTAAMFGLAFYIIARLIITHEARYDRNLGIYMTGAAASLFGIVAVWIIVLISNGLVSQSRAERFAKRSCFVLILLVVLSFVTPFILAAIVTGPGS